MFASVKYYYLAVLYSGESPAIAQYQGSLFFGHPSNKAPPTAHASDQITLRAPPSHLRSVLQSSLSTYHTCIFQNRPFIVNQAHLPRECLLQNRERWP